MSTSGTGEPSEIACSSNKSYICMFCMNSTKAIDYPKVCTWCEVFFCGICFSRLKAASLVCAGCGDVLPTGHAIFYPATSLAAASGLISWLKEGSTSGYVFDIAKNMDTEDSDGWRIVKILAHGEQIDSKPIRELDKSEVKLLLARITELREERAKSDKTDKD